MSRKLYTLCLGLLISITVVASISYAYIPPKMPEYPTALSAGPAMYDQPAAMNNGAVLQKKYDADMKIYNMEQGKYTVMLNLIKITAAAILIMLAALALTKVLFLPESFLVGGAALLLSLSSTFFTFYTFESSGLPDPTFRLSVQQLVAFYAVTIIAALVGYMTFKDKKKAAV